MRKLKFHENNLLKKVDFLDWKRVGSQRENDVMRRYHVTQRDDYQKQYSKLCGTVQKLVNMLKQLASKGPFRIEMTDVLLEKLSNMGVISSQKSLALCDKLSVASFCRCVSREDFVIWVDSSKIRQKVLEYNDEIERL